MTYRWLKARGWFWRRAGLIGWVIVVIGLTIALYGQHSLNIRLEQEQQERAEALEREQERRTEVICRQAEETRDIVAGILQSAEELVESQEPPSTNTEIWMLRRDQAIQFYEEGIATLREPACEELDTPIGLPR